MKNNIKKILQISVCLILLVSINSCYVNKYPVKYSIYKGNKEINFPQNKIEITLLNDTAGIFKNYLSSDTVFSQKFKYEISGSAFLLINSLDTLHQNAISLNNNDTIIVYKRKMLYFYNGETKYLLYFKEKHSGLF